MFKLGSQRGNGRKLVAFVVIFVLVVVVTGACTRVPGPKSDSSSSGIQTVSFDNTRDFKNDATFWNSHDCQSQWIAQSFTNVTCKAIAVNFDYCWANQLDKSDYCQDFIK